MRHKTRILSTALVTTSLALATGIAIAALNVTPWTATETGGAIIDNGTISTTPDGYTLIRGYTRQFDRDAADPRVSGGTLQAAMNFNLDANMTGPMWGTFHWEVGNGVWDGTFHGYFNMATGLGEYESVGHGRGDFAGLEFREQCVYTAPGTGTVAGKIISTSTN